MYTMLKTWTLSLIPLVFLGLSGCASTNADTNSNSKVTNTAEKKAAKECDKVASIGSNIGRCKK
ncbi:hypothetical protein FJD32_020410 [Shewanella sp. LC6]|jgi:uncharacterized protein YceK|nr:hypothetical protein CEQ32_13500 [Shewanella sp. FDAARGOS_354]MBW0278994.1 hypothetical protein [Shewanella xiamenensis]QQK61632.1 hypothetical protein FJD32_020410 [Shewanella sp. LC6]TPE64552.1 hypothetical protein FJD33_02460 [Shewanella sp. LC2]MBW0295642.1 hypothetical protein [Shewanella xiamenensis]